ncbi:MAG: SMP-30/gluconolactonase/LRE family protein [Cohaesibacteraceae bacterium]|nr:SMP-30/gluconolactonase/LRE family protein [Cohaesibacteraceae bacterium]MBL4875248.1 SMP-30/gluconolactonase/LRE family protein [Cohaesibacteraceae bacterium]
MNLKPLIKSLLNSSNVLGEGPLWHVDQQALYWVDIVACELHKFENQRHQIWQFDKKISAVVETVTGGLALAISDGVALFNPVSGQLDYICKLDEDLPNNRTNDAKVDPLGKFWVGTMSDGEGDQFTQSGRLWSVDKDGKSTRLLDNIGISNTLAWDEHRSKFYFADSAMATIYQFNYDRKNGLIKKQEVFVKLKDKIAPDGSCIDNDGYLWNCQWDGWRIVRYTPCGNVDLVIKLPVQRPTSCAFGGKNFTLLYVTSAKLGLTEAELEQQPQAGDIFVIDLAQLGIKAKGSASNLFGNSA